MPYVVRKRGTRYAVVNKATGKTKGTHASKAAAQRQVNLLRGVEHGWKPTGKLARNRRAKRREK
jgi:hypothetical protein